jgi:predicted RNA polymerase sigma factor
VATDVVGPVPSPAGFDTNIVANGPSRLPQLFEESGVENRCYWIVFGKVLENANPPHTLGLLRASHYWPRHSRPTKNTKKFPPPHIRPSLRRRHRSGSNEYFHRAETASRLQYEMRADVRDGSLADKTAGLRDVCCTPESRHQAETLDVRYVPCVDGSELARAFFT